jgi:ATP phosphoribosyltransferase regulatory subunit
LKWLAERLEGVRIGFDLADARGYAYYSGMRSRSTPVRATRCCAAGATTVGAVFGRDRDRPAVGFSLDLKQLVRAVPQPLRAAIRAPWGDAPGLAAAVPRCAARRDGGARAAGRGRRAGRISLRPRAGAAWRALGRGAL